MGWLKRKCRKVLKTSDLQPSGVAHQGQEVEPDGCAVVLTVSKFSNQTAIAYMEKLTCKTCGCESLRPMQVVFDEEQDDLNLIGEEQESRFYSCQVCGDNWLSVKEKTADGHCTITFVHQMGTNPVLKRVAHMSNSIVLSDESVDEWEYYKGDETVEESEWEEILSDRRDTLKATCMN